LHLALFSNYTKCYKKYVSFNTNIILGIKNEKVINCFSFINSGSLASAATVYDKDGKTLSIVGLV